MADNYLITGYWGEPHVTAENDRGINAAIFGTGRFVLPVGEKFRAEYIGNNTIRMYDGKLVDNGAAAGIPAGEYVDLLIANAGQGMNRNDLIVFEYSQDSSTMVESGVFRVIQGTEVSGTASDPELTQQNLLSGDATFDQMALYRVTVSGTAISAPVPIFGVKGTPGMHMGTVTDQPWYTGANMTTYEFIDAMPVDSVGIFRAAASTKVLSDLPYTWMQIFVIKGVTMNFANVLGFRVSHANTPQLWVYSANADGGAGAWLQL